MFTGLDLLVIFGVILGIFYLARPSGETKVQFEPLTFLVVTVVMLMLVVSVT